MKNIILLLITWLTSTIIGYSQLVVTTGQTATQLAQDIVGAGVSISNATFSGSANQAGVFSNGAATNLGLNSGIVLSTGNVSDIANSSATFASTDLNGGSDPDLLNISGATTIYDAAVLQFDFVPSGPNVSFSFVFGSEEYPSFVNSINDAFGIFLSGPGISGTFSNGATNIAVVPSTSVPISINTVNNGNGDCLFGTLGPCENCAYYVDNCSGSSIVFDGFTTVITSTYSVQCGQTYHLKIAIGDAEDGIYDSGVFIQANSLTSPYITITPDPAVICNGDNITLTATVSNPNGGTFSWVPGGQTTPTVNVAPTTNTQYVVHYTKAGCDIKDSVMVTVNNCSTPCNIDTLVANIGACNGTNNTFDLTGHLAFTNAPATGQLIVADCNGHQQTFNAPFTSPQSFTISGIPADGAACSVTAHFTADATCTQTLTYTNPNGCSCVATIGTYSTTTTGDGQLSGGVYRLCYGDQLTFKNTGGFNPPANIGNDPSQVPPVAYNPGIGYLVYSCPPSVISPNDITTDPCLIGQVAYSGPNGGFTLTNNGTPPIAGGTNNILYFVPITFYDTINGYYSYTNSGVNCYAIGSPIAVQFLPQITSSNPTPNCANGTFTVTINGGLPQIDGSQFTASNLIPATATFTNTACNNGGTIAISGLQNGDNYSFDVADANGCPITITGGPFVGTPNANAGVDDTATCGSLTYTLAATPSFGTGTWTGPAGVTFGNVNSATSTVTVPSPGSYTLTWIENNGGGCTDQDQVVVTFIPNPTFTVSSTNPTTCVATDGSITLSGLTANTSYSVSYNGGAASNMTSDGTGNIIISGLASGTYTPFTVTTSEGCSTTVNTIITLAAPSAPTVTATGGTMCVNGTAIISATGSPSGGTYSWNNGAGTNPSATVNPSSTTTYTVTYSEGGCTTTATAIVTVNPLPIINAGIDQTVCEGTSVTLSGSGAGTGGSYSWDNAVTNGTPFTPSTGTIKYTVTGTDGNGCVNKDSVNVTVNPNPTFTLSSTNPTTCSSIDGTIVISGLTPNTSYTVAFSGGATTSYTSTGTGIITLAGLVAGTYTSFTVTSASGCSTTDNSSITLTAPATPTVTATNASICVGATATITATGTPAGGTYSWSPATGLNGTSIATVSANPNTTTTYTASYTANGCTVTANSIVTVHQLPIIDAGADQSVCSGSSVTISGSGAGSGGSYSWNNGITDGQTFVPTADSTTYTVTGTDANGCVNTDQITVKVNPIPTPTLIADKGMGCAPFTVNFKNTSIDRTNSVSCNWDFGDGGGANSCDSIVTYTFNTPGTYSITLTETSQYGCIGTVTEPDYIIVKPVAIAQFTVDPKNPTTMNTQLYMTNQSVNAASYTWSFGDGSASETGFNATHIFPSDSGGSYTITLIAANVDPSCNDTTQYNITINEETVFYVPNTFTPDGDEFNNVFKPVFSSGYDPQSYTLQIFDRWGELIFETHNTNFGWDGTYGGKRVQDGTYVWKINFKAKASTKDFSRVGHVNVLR